MKLQVRLIWHSSKAWQAFKWALVGFQVRPCWRFPAWAYLKWGSPGIRSDEVCLVSWWLWWNIRVFRNLEWQGCPPKFRTLTKCHTEIRRTRRNIKNKIMKGTEAPLVRGATEVIWEFYQSICLWELWIVFIPKIKETRMLPLCHSLVPSVPPWYFSLCFLRFSVCLIM